MLNKSSSPLPATRGISRANSRKPENQPTTDRPWTNTRYLDRYHFTRDVLAHLPSAETVWVLGTMLESEEDVRTREEKIRIAKESSRAGGGGLSSVTAPRYLAIQALHRLGLRNYPSDGPFDARLGWWSRVKSGEIPFSFVGEPVEYRFNQDGTWETIPIANPPDDGPQIPREISPSQNPQPSPASTQSPESRENGSARYLLVGMITLFCVAVVGYLARRHIRTHP
jgi:hypothetical protein